MSEARCVTCGATLIPGTGFCRQCGAPAVADLEEPTALLDQHGQSGDGTTRRLDPRPTNPYQESSSEKVPATGRNGRLIFVGVVAVAVLACVTIVGVVRSVMNKKQSAAPAIHVTRTLMYPASRVVLDLGDSGGAVLQLATTDPLDKVETWYGAQLKPDKILRATMNTSILRKDNVTVTLVMENNTTSIVIKQNR